MVKPDKYTLAAMAEMSRLQWKEKISFKYRKCFLSGRPIRPLTKAMVGFKVVRGITGIDGMHLVVKRWALADEYTMAKLKE